MPDSLVTRSGLAAGTYVQVIQDASGQYWNGSAFEAYNASNIATYGVVAQVVGITGANAYQYSQEFPALIVAAGNYSVRLCFQAGGSFAVSDLAAVVGQSTEHWTGAAWAVQTGDAYAVVNSGTHGNAALLTAIDGISAGTGAYPVNHDGGSGAGSVSMSFYLPYTAGSSVTSSTDVLRFLISGVGAANAVVRAYLTSAFDSGTRAQLGQATLLATGRWGQPINLDSGTYYLIVNDPGVAEAYQAKVVVP